MHLHVATSLHNLAVLYRAQERHVEAEPLFARAVTILEEALGTDHLDTALALENHALLLREMQRVEEANRLGARVKAIRAKHAEASP